MVKPNAFVSIRVPSLEIKEKLTKVQEEAVKANSSLMTSMVSLKKLHLTLMVLNLSNEEEEERAKRILSEVTVKIKERFSFDKEPFKLELEGLDHFYGGVVFAKIKTTPAFDQLKEIAAIVHEAYSNGGLPTTDKRDFNPHLTVAKVSNASWSDRRTLGRKGIPLETFSAFVEEKFGEQVVEGLELLSMSKPRDEEGYYYCFEKLPFA